MFDTSHLVYIHESESDSISGKNLTIHFVDDDRRLHKTANELNWKSFLDKETFFGG